MALDGYIAVLALATLPALGNIGGGVLAEVFRVSEQKLSLALHLAAGIVIAVVGIELMPEALGVRPAWLILLAFVTGGGFAILIDRFTEFVDARTGGGTGLSGALAVYSGVAVDLFSDGIMIGTGSTINLSLGLLLALGQVPADIPEGFATIATFKSRGVTRPTRIILSLSFAIPIFLGASLGYWAVRGRADVFKYGLLAFTAGILLTIVIEEIVPEAHRDEEAEFAALALVGGFAIFGAITVYL